MVWPQHSLQGQLLWLQSCLAGDTGDRTEGWGCGQCRVAAPWGAALAGEDCSGCCAVLGCRHLGAVSGDTGHPRVLCCTRLSDLGTVSWDTRGCCAVPEEKHRGPGSDHNPHSAPVSPVLSMGSAPQGPWVPKEETWGSTRRSVEEQGPGCLCRERGHSHLQSRDHQGPCVHISLAMLPRARGCSAWGN